MRYQPKNRRRGAATVEMAFVSVLLFMLLFGIFEYCRFLFVLHVSNNAARDAVRYAVVRTGGVGTMSGDPLTVSEADIVSICTFGTIQGQNVGSGMSNMENNIVGYAVDVFAVDPDGLLLTPPVIQPKPGSPLPGWNDAAFGEKIAVQITGTYQPIVPNLLMMNASIPFKVVVMYSSEAN